MISSFHAIANESYKDVNPAIYDLLAENLGSLPPSLQVQAMGVLEFSGIRNHAAVIEPLLASGNEHCRNAAAQALARMGTKDSVG